MTKNIATAMMTAAGSTTSRSLGDRAATIINVKDYGATANGVTDDAAAIQSAFDAAFGTAGSPHGNGSKYSNRSVYFPAGHYIVKTPLYLTTIVGGYVFGDGSSYTLLDYQGAFSGNTVIANGITPVLFMNGVSYSRIEGLGFTTTNSNSCCIYIFTSASNTSTTNLFVDVSVANATAGILAGYQALNGTCSECTYIDCSFSTCTFGLRIILQNALNHAVYGGSVSNCTTGLSNITSGLAVVNNVAFALNTTDIETNSAAQAMAVVGGRTEQNVTTSILVEACQAYVSGFTYESTATLIDASTSGSVVLDGCNFAGGSGVIAALGSTGLVIMDNMVSAVGTSTITGTAGSKLYLRGCQFGNANTITGFGGTVAQNI